MKKLVKEIKSEFTKNMNSFKSDLKKSNLQTILNAWYFTDLCTPAKLKAIKSGAMSLKEAKIYLIDRKTEQQTKRLNEKLNKIEMVKNAPNLKSASIQIQWIDSRTWGANPRPEMSERTDNGYYTYSYGSITGYGYCKQSTAVAEVLNQSPSILKILYTAKNKKFVFDYGLTSGILPNFLGGTGVECYVRIFNSLGYEMKKIVNDKMFDAWTIEPFTPARKKEFKKRGY